MQFLPRYTHIVNPRLKHIYLMLDDHGELIIKSPKVSQKRIEQLLLQKASWITKAKKKIEEKKGKPLNFTQESELYFLGEAHTFCLKKYANKHAKLHFDGDIFTLLYHHYDETLFHKKIDLFYKKEAIAHVTPLLSRWSKRMGLPFNHLAFRKTRRQWGSCSSNNHISINTMVMKLPPRVIEYVIVHELAHIRYKHHQKDFWKLVAYYMPDYQTHIKTLKNYTP